MITEEAMKEYLKVYKQLCESLKLDKPTMSAAWQNFSKIYQNCILDGPACHWLGCAIYTTYHCSSETFNSTVPSSRDVLQLGVLLQSIDVGVLIFIDKLKKWIEHVTHSKNISGKIKELENTVTVSIVLFQKFQPIFFNIFKEIQSNNKSENNDNVSVLDVFKFTWTLFVLVKSYYSKFKTDLVNSFNLLLACFDLIFNNISMSKSKSLIRESFHKELNSFSESQNVINTLCRLYDGLPVDVTEVKEYTLKKNLKTLFETHNLKGDVNSLTKIFDLKHYESNLKKIDMCYCNHIQKTGDFDERLFLGNSKMLLGTVMKNDIFKVSSTDSYENNKSLDIFNSPKNVNDDPFKKPVCPPTPLTGKYYLDQQFGKYKPKYDGFSVVHTIEILISGVGPTPSDFTKSLITKCQWSSHLELFIDKMLDEIKLNLNEVDGEYEKISSEKIKKIEDMTKCLFFKFLDPILKDEVRKSSFVDVKLLLDQEIFHKSLFACSLEIILFSFNNIRNFQWVLSVLSLNPYHFYRIIEIVVSTEFLSREIIKHLNRIEETILENLVWKRKSPLWKGIIESGKPVPSCEDVTNSQSLEVTVQNVLETKSDLDSDDKLNILASRESLLTNLPSGPLSDRFVSSASPSKRCHETDVSEGPLTKKSCLIYPGSSDNICKENRKPKKAGALGLFFRKFYYLASVRMQNMCNQLNILSTSLRRKIWTCFERIIVNHIGLMLDRHLDQILMCTIYVICKIVGPKITFIEIMNCYRNQPQAQSSVYRSVVISPDLSLDDLKKFENTSLPNIDQINHLIEFYNSVYVKKLHNMLRLFSGENADNDRVILSPIPLSKGSIGARKVSENFVLFLKSSGENSDETGNTNHLTYCLNQSPAKDLEAINRMVSNGISQFKRDKVRKIILQNDDEAQATSHGVASIRRLEGIHFDRNKNKNN